MMSPRHHQSLATRDGSMPLPHLATSHHLGRDVLHVAQHHYVCGGVQRTMHALSSRRHSVSMVSTEQRMWNTTSLRV